MTIDNDKSMLDNKHMGKTKEEQTVILYIRVPESWHKELSAIATKTGNNIGSLLRPYIYLAMEDIKYKYNKED